MIGVGTSLLFGRKAGKAGPPIPPFNKAMVDAWFMSGLSNIDKPSSIKGVMGNEMVLNNFAYSLSSGFGKYEIDFNSWRTNNNISYRNSIEFKAEFNKDERKGRKYFLQHPDTEKINSFRIKVISNHTAEDIYELEYRYLNSDKQIQYFKISSDGEYTLPASFPTDETKVTYTNKLGFAYSTYSLKDISFTITQLPSAYEDALVFDGVDDYGICTGLPILDDYTVICKREIINKETGSVASKRTSPSQWNGAFIFERNNQLTSFGQNNYRTIQQNNVSYMTTTSYNGNTISRGSLQDTEYLILGADGFNITLNKAHGFSNCAIYYFALYNKSLTPEEIETEKERLNEEWLKRSKVTIPEPDVYYDLSLKDNSSPTRNIIDDLSGNGHDAEIFNAAYTESSGYRSDGAFVFDGVDDYAIMKNVKKGFKTVFMEVIPSLTKERGGFIYDQRVGRTSFGINIFTNDIAYNSYNWDGVTYINGKLNTTIKGSEVYLKHQIITIVNGTDLKPQKVVLGGDIGLAGYFSNMALYKLIGFYDELTPLQIEKVINDYKLKYN